VAHFFPNPYGRRILVRVGPALAVAGSLLFTLALFAAAAASGHYTERQLEALASRVGKIFWIKPADGKLPSFRSAPASGASIFAAEERDSFQIIELGGKAENNPYYKVKFASGKEGYIGPESFHEELNLTIFTADPYADEKRRIDEAAKAEKTRVEWIQAQPWTPDIKKAAINKVPVPGLTTGEIRRVLGAPSQVIKLRGPAKVVEERWYYPDGKVLTFHNGLLSIINQQRKD
jgi:hypothetical protein